MVVSTLRREQDRHATPVRAAAAPTGADPRYQAFALLRIAFTVAPIAFGIDTVASVYDAPRSR